MIANWKSEGNPEYGSMILDSGHNLNDLGSFDHCNSQNFSHYMTVEFALKISLSTSLWMGACVPMDCTQQDLSVLNETTKNLINELVGN